MSIKLFLAVMVLTFGISGTAFAAENSPAITNIQAPVGMIYDAQGNLFVAEWGAGRVSRFDPQGKRSTVTDAIRSPSGLAFDDNGAPPMWTAMSIAWTQATSRVLSLPAFLHPQGFCGPAIIPC